MDTTGNSRKRLGKQYKPVEKKLMVAEFTTDGMATVSSPAFPIGNHSVTKAEIIKELSTEKESNILLNEIIEITRLPLKTLAVNIYDVTPKTLASYKTKGRYFPKRMVEVSIKVRDLYKKGIGIFSSTNRFNIWLNRESFGLGNMPPLDLMSTSTGIDLIYEELLRIEFGAMA
jgi:hypothetical protein